MNLKTSKIDSLLFWIAWAFGGGFIGSLFFPIRWYVVGTLTLTYYLVWLIVNKIMFNKKQTDSGTVIRM